MARRWGWHHRVGAVAFLRRVIVTADGRCVLGGRRGDISTTLAATATTRFFWRASYSLALFWFGRSRMVLGDVVDTEVPLLPQRTASPLLPAWHRQSQVIMQSA